jgi:hypothetical protein
MDTSLQVNVLHSIIFLSSVYGLDRLCLRDTEY